MSSLGDLAHVAVRQVAAAAASSAVAPATPEASDKPACSTSNEFDGRIGLRISAIFVILVGSLFGMNLSGKPKYCR